MLIHVNIIVLLAAILVGCSEANQAVDSTLCRTKTYIIYTQLQHVQVLLKG